MSELEYESDLKSDGDKPYEFESRYPHSSSLKDFLRVAT